MLTCSCDLAAWGSRRRRRLQGPRGLELSLGKSRQAAREEAMFVWVGGWEQARPWRWAWQYPSNSSLCWAEWGLRPWPAGLVGSSPSSHLETTSR